MTANSRELARDLLQLRKMFKNGVLVVLMTIIVGCAGEASTISLDQQLMQAIQQQKLTRFKDLLEEGANPNAIFGSQPTEWVMCMAMYPDYEPYMELVLEHGGDINLRNATPPLDTSLLLSGDSAPLLCAIRGKGYPAFNALMARGVELDIKNCRDCQSFAGNKKLNIGPNSNYMTPIITASNQDRWEMAYKMIEKRKTLRWQEINQLVYELELGSGISKASDANRWRLKVAEQLNSMGHKVIVDQGSSRIKVPKWGDAAVF